MHYLQILQILKNHSIESEAQDTSNPQVFALDVQAGTNIVQCTWLNVTNWNRAELYNWLGY